MPLNIRKITSFLLLLALLAGLCACGENTAADEGTEETFTLETTSEDSVENDESTAQPTQTEEPAATEEPLSETALAEQAIVDEIKYNESNFVTEADFYEALNEILALHDLELTRYPGDNAYYYLNYSNVGSVKLLTIAKTAEEIAADQKQAQLDYEAEVAAYAAKKETLAAENETADSSTEEQPQATDGVAADDLIDADAEESIEEENAHFDASKDVENSDDLVVSFVLSATNTDIDQQLLFLISSAVWSIMSPKYDNTDESFEYLWRALFSTYIQSGGLSASTIDGFDNSFSFTIPGNGIEAWIGTDDAGNYIVAITMYVEYDEIIEVTSSTDESFQSAVSAMSSLYD